MMIEFIMKLIQWKIDRLTRREDKILKTLRECYAALERWEQRK